MTMMFEYTYWVNIGEHDATYVTVIATHREEADDLCRKVMQNVAFNKEELDKYLNNKDYDTVAVLESIKQLPLYSKEEDE